MAAERERHRFKSRGTEGPWTPHAQDRISACESFTLMGMWEWELRSAVPLIHKGAGWGHRQSICFHAMGGRDPFPRTGWGRSSSTLPPASIPGAPLPQLSAASRRKCRVSRAGEPIARPSGRFHNSPALLPITKGANSLGPTARFVLGVSPLHPDTPTPSPVCGASAWWF